VVVSYDLIHDYDIKSFAVILRNSDTSERLKIIDDDYIELGTQPTSTIHFTIPDDHGFAGENVYLYIEMWDIHQNRIIMDLPRFSVQANTKLPAPFNNFIEVYKTLNNNYGSSQSNYSYNVIDKVITDDNNIVHMLISSTARYSIDYQTYCNIDYYYITYDFNAKQLSTPIKVTTINGKNIDNFEDFILLDGKPFVLFGDGTTYKFTYRNGSSFTSLQTAVSKSTIKWDDVQFFTSDNSIYVKWVDSEGGSTSAERRNRFKEIFPSLGGEQVFDNSYLGVEVRVDGDYLYAYCGKVYSINSDLTVNQLVFQSENTGCSLGGEFKDYSTLHNIISFSTDYYKGIELISKDFASSILESTSQYGANEVSVFDDKIVVVSAKNDQNFISIYDNNMNRLSQISIGKYADGNYNYQKADINQNQILALSGIEYEKAYLAVADLSSDIVAPNITLSNDEIDIEVGSNITLNWTATDNNNELTKYEVYKVTGGEEYLLDTITDLSQTSFTYTQESNNEKFIQLKVVAYDSSSNSNYATLPLKVHQKITFSSFSTDKTAINLGEQITFSWSSSGGDESTQFTVYKKAVDESEWNPLFTTMGNSKSYVVKDFVGEYEFKIMSGSSSLQANHNLVVNGELLDFKEELFKPQNSYYKLGNNIKFEWADTLTTTSVLYDVWLKKSGESTFTLIGSTSDKYLEYVGDIDGSFAWKVSAKFGEAIVESNVVQATVFVLQSPQISDINFTLNGDTPTINLAFPNVEEVDSYLIVKEHDGLYEEIPITYQSSYTDTNINYGRSYTYSILAVQDGIKTEIGESQTIVASLNEQYAVVIDTENQQISDSNSITVQYHPNQEIEYERYEIWLGTDPDNLMRYDITQNREYAFSNLKYTTNYYVEIYPIDFNGNHVSAIPAKLLFTTGFDTREITLKPVLSISEVGSDMATIFHTNSSKTLSSYFR
jgi:hypothetical protein